MSAPERSAVLEENYELRQFVCARLSEGWSPEQISGWLKAGAEPGLRPLATETIHAFIYRASQKAERLWLYLCRRHKWRGRRKRRGGDGVIKDRASIHERLQAIDALEETGHWEGNLIFCRRPRPILVLHERKSRFTLAARASPSIVLRTILTPRKCLGFITSFQAILKELGKNVEIRFA